MADFCILLTVVQVSPIALRSTTFTADILFPKGLRLSLYPQQLLDAHTFSQHDRDAECLVCGMLFLVIIASIDGGFVGR